MNKKVLQPLNIWSLFAFIMVFQIIGAGIGLSTAEEIQGWYETLHKSPLTPPGYIFGVVWSALYLFLAIVGWQQTRRPSGTEKSKILKLFAAHMVLNWSWSIVFFKLHALVVSFAMIVVIFITAIYLTIRFYKTDKLSFFLMIPYLTWLIFAGYLSFYIVLYN